MTARTHLRLCVPHFVEVEDIDLVQAASALRFRSNVATFLHVQTPDSKRYAGLSHGELEHHPRTVLLGHGPGYRADVLETMGAYR